MSTTVVVAGVGTARGAAAGASRAARGPHAVVAGHARFEVLSPTLIRLEYAPDGRFENRHTIVAEDRRPISAYRSRVSHGMLTIRTSALVLRYREGGPFTAKNLSIRPVHGRWHARPTWQPGEARGNLGGWVRALDDRQGPVPLHPGLLTRAGWNLLDDSTDALLTRHTPGFTSRHTPAGYQDGYFFGYGDRFTTALRDLRRLTGPAPLLPRTAFGVWFSRYFAYSAADYRMLLRQFRRHRVPIDTLSIDTDWKRQPSPLSNVLAQTVIGKTRAYSWNGWEWNHTLFPHPGRTIRWLHRHGIDVALNIHPSIDSTDPKYAATVARTGALPTDPTCTLEQVDPLGLCHVFDLTQARQLSAYFGLHAPIKAAGVDEWWLDWCCDATTASAPGLTPDTWLNLQYHRHLEPGGDRWLVLSRVGGSHGGGDSVAGPGDGIFAEHRNAIHFTGDTCATWGMLAFEARLTAEEGNIGLPYVSHDIGSFNGAPIRGQCGPSAGASGAKDPPRIYARWVQFGALQPILRLHSNHGARLPWEYPNLARRAAADALRLREALVPYLYTLARDAYDTGMPITRSLYLQWPRRPAAYRHPSEYTVGRDVLFRPVTAAGARPPDTLWFPPGRWVDYFTGRIITGPSVHTLHVPLDEMAMFVRAGAILPTEPSVTHTSKRAPRRLTLSVFGPGNGQSRLYDDNGTGFAYRHGAYTWTTIRHTTRGAVQTLRIGPASGHFRGMPHRRSWTVQFRDVAPPRSVQVNAQRANWSYSSSTRTLTVRTGPQTTAAAMTVRLLPRSDVFRRSLLDVRHADWGALGFEVAHNVSRCDRKTGQSCANEYVVCHVVCCFGPI
jgi:hypothetical protein